MARHFRICQYTGDHADSQGYCYQCGGSDCVLVYAPLAGQAERCPKHSGPFGRTTTDASGETRVLSCADCERVRANYIEARNALDIEEGRANVLELENLRLRAELAKR